MPNHYATKLEFTHPAQLAIVKALYKNKDYEICRDVMPMPDIFNHTQSPSNGMYCEDDPQYPKCGIKIGVREFTAEERFIFVREGVDNWYDWANKNWGTKWGTYDASFRNGCMYFNSAWCPPQEVIFQKFADKYSLSFDVWGHDEGVKDFDYSGGYDGTDYEAPEVDVQEPVQVKRIKPINLWVVVKDGKAIPVIYYTRKEARMVSKKAKTFGIKLSVKKALIQKG
jgi:hypothetical protein